MQSLPGAPLLLLLLLPGAGLKNKPTYPRSLRSRSLTLKVTSSTHLCPGPLPTPRLPMGMFCTQAQERHAGGAACVRLSCHGDLDFCLGAGRTGKGCAYRQVSNNRAWVQDALVQSHLSGWCFTGEWINCIEGRCQTPSAAG